MGKFTPANHHLGKQCYAMRKGKPNEHLGTLQQIVSPHCFVINGSSFEVDVTYDFHPGEDGHIYLVEPF